MVSTPNLKVQAMHNCLVTTILTLPLSHQQGAVLDRFLRAALVGGETFPVDVDGADAAVVVEEALVDPEPCQRLCH